MYIFCSKALADALNIKKLRYTLVQTKVIIPLQFLYFRDTKSKLFSFILYFLGVTPYFCLNALIKWLQSQNPVSWLI